MQVITRGLKIGKRREIAEVAFLEQFPQESPIAARLLTPDIAGLGIGDGGERRKGKPLNCPESAASAVGNEMG